MAEVSSSPAEDAPQPRTPRVLAPAPNEAPPPETPDAPRPIVDVWSRSERKYRIRAFVLLLANFLLFCGLCVFTHWLHVAQPFEFTLESYLEPLRFWGPQTQNLNDFVLYPISVEQTPMHGVVLGLLMASIVAVPISVAILYRFPFALPFAAAVIIFAHMPWMGITLVGCCILASVKPFRLSFRFGAGLVGLLPVILYLYLATRGTPQQIGTYASPDQKLLLAAPWILAIIAACAMLGVILTIARVVNYRPGPVAPVMAVMFATPTVLFSEYVGFDEVSYRVLESEYGPRSERFAAYDAGSEILSILRSVPDEPLQERLLGIWGGRLESLVALHQQLIHRLQKELLTDRRAAYEACRAFIADHPSSPYVSNVLYLQARALDTRLDVRKLLPPSVPPWRELYVDYPHVQSEEAWLPLLNKFADSPLAVAARLRLAELALRQGDTPRARQLLSQRADPQQDASTRPSTRPSADPTLLPEHLRSLGFDAKPYVREGRRLLELINANAADPKYAARPLRAFACLDPHRPTYREQLLHLSDQYPDALLHDNLVVQWAASEPDRGARAARLAACLDNFTAGDARPEAMFRLAEIEVQARSANHEARRRRGLSLLRSLVRDYPDTVWSTMAAERLRILEPQAEPPATTTAQQEQP